MFARFVEEIDKYAADGVNKLLVGRWDRAQQAEWLIRVDKRK